MLSYLNQYLKLSLVQKSKQTIGILHNLAQDIVEDVVDVEAADVAAIAHLRSRAVAAKDEKLLVEIKSIAAKFFDIHTSIYSH